MKPIFRFDLPWPLSKERRHYHRRGFADLVKVEMIAPSIRLHVVIEAFPPDRRRRDLNILGKDLLDALQYARVFENKGQIDWLEIRRRHIIRPGSVVVSIEEIPAGEEA